MKSSKAYIILGIILVIMVATLSYIKTQQKKPVDWTPSFYNIDTKPYGTYIAYRLLDDVFSEGKVRSTRRPIYNNLKDTLETYFEYDTYTSDYSDYDEYDNYDYDEYEGEVESLNSDTLPTVDLVQVPSEDNDSEPDNAMIDQLYGHLNISDTTSYLFVNLDFSLDKLDLEYLLDFVGLGNNVFISTENFNGKLLDTLKINQEKQFYKTDSIYSLVDYPNTKYAFTAIYNQSFFNTDKSTLPIRVLAKNSQNQAVFVQVQYGKGYFYLHSLPIAFANYSLLKPEKYDFAFRSLSYLPRNSKVIWDEYQKQGMIGEESMFREIYASRSLFLALCVTILGFILFILFRAKRTQRIIPIIKPPINSSLEFLDTISNLYYHHRDFITIAQKRQAYFYEYIRKNYYLSTEHIGGEFIKSLSGKSGMPVEKLNDLFDLYKDISTSYEISNEVFLQYNSLLEEFYRIVENKK